MPRSIILCTYIVLAVIMLFFSVSSAIFAASLVNVPLNHQVYRFIDRLQAKGILGEYLSNSKPYSRGEVAEMIMQASLSLEDGRVKLTNIDVELLEDLKREFSNELADLGDPGVQGYKHLLDWADEDRMLVTEMGFMQDTSFNADGEAYTSTFKVSLYGDIYRNISFYNCSRASYNEGKEAPLWKRNDPRYLWRYPWSALSDAYVTFGIPKINVQAGKDAVLWGAGQHGVIGLTAIEPAFDLVRFRTKMWKLNFTSVLGFLRDDLTKEYQSQVPAKYLSAHRVEIIPYPGISVAWQEVYIYAEKLHIELLNPIMPYQMAEDYLGEIGNNTMEFDAEISLIPGAKVYSALFLDDFHPDRSPFKYSGFGWAVLGGTMIADPLGLDNTDLTLEYSRVEPWTYTHRGTLQDPPIPTAYKHFDEPLGHWIGPNADDLFAQVGWQINRKIRGSVSYNRIRHGEVGGNIYDAPEDYDEDKTFLEGIVENRRAVRLGFEYTAFHRTDLCVYYKCINIKNRQKEEAKLPKSSQRKQDWERGWNSTESEFGLTIQFTY
jgi:hypothetical protein